MGGGSDDPPLLFSSPFPSSPALLLADEIRDAWRSEPRDHRVALVFIAVVTVTLRLLYLDQPMRYDESVTYMYFVRHPWTDALSLYTYPNNHLFHTLLAKASVTLFGAQPWALRLPALLAGVLVVPATYAAARALYGGGPALFAAAVVASSTALAMYSTSARGYTIVILAFLLLVLLGARLIQRSSRADWLAFVILAALGLWTIPVMLFPLGTVALWLGLTFLVQRRTGEVSRLFVALLMAAGLAVLAYLPVVLREGLPAITHNKFVAAAPWVNFFEALPIVLRGALRSWGLGVPPIIFFPLLSLAVIALCYHARVSRVPVGLPLAAFVWSCWVLVVNHQAPFPRVFLWLLPIVAALIGAGLFVVDAHRARPTKFVEAYAPALAIGLALVMFASIVLSRAVLLTRDTGTYRDAEEAVGVLRGALRPGDLVLAGVPSNAPLDYYADRVGLSPSYFTTPIDNARRVVVVVDAVEGQTLQGVVGARPVGDTTQFAPGSVLARLPSSTLYVFERRAPAK